MTVLTNLVVNKYVKAKENIADNQFHNILRRFNVLPNFLSPQVKQSVIVIYKYGIQQLPYELPNNLKLRILGN